MSLYREYLIKCTSNAGSVDNYSDFQRIDKWIKTKYPDFTGIISIDNSDEAQKLYDELSSWDSMPDDHKQNFTFKKIGGGQYHNALLHYIDFLKCYEFFSNQESKQKDVSLGSLKSLPLQQIYYGAPGTGKSHIINEMTEGESVIRTTFHPDSDYSTFVGSYKPTTKEITMRDPSGQPIKENGKELKEDKIVYEFVEQAFLQAYVQAWKFYADAAEGEPQKQYLVIEEINRGNCAQIFGDLFQLLDRNTAGFSDYPINADNDMKKQLAKAFTGLTIAQKDGINACYRGRDVVSKVLSGDILLLPNNLYIWATMNTSDQSLFPIDSAFKRRWDWQYMPISEGRDKNGNKLKWKIVTDTKEYNWWSFVETINEHIGTTTNSEDKKLGFFFCKAADGVISAETFVGKVIFYLWNDVFKDFGFDDAIFKNSDGGKLTFDKFYATDETNGRTIVQKDKVELFMKNLGVEGTEIQDDVAGGDEDEDDSPNESNE